MKTNKLKLLSIAICSFVIALWSDSQCMEDGYYTISNCALRGKITYTNKESESGYYVQALSGPIYNSAREFYEPGGRGRNNVLWYISLAEGGYYTISNCALGGKITYTNEESSRGHYMQALSGSTYNREKEFYEPGGRGRNNVLWHISPAEGGYYTISNCALGGKITYTNKESESGYYVQALSGPTYNREKEFYAPGGGGRSSVLWHISPATS